MYGLFFFLVVSLNDDTITQMTSRLCIRRLNNNNSISITHNNIGAVYKQTSHKRASFFVVYWFELCPVNIFWDLSVLYIRLDILLIPEIFSSSDSFLFVKDYRIDLVFFSSFVISIALQNVLKIFSARST